jgi:hypothetical protein
MRRPRTNRIEARVFQKKKPGAREFAPGKSMLDRADSPAVLTSSAPASTQISRRRS